jgi:hypothetical protein
LPDSTTEASASSVSSIGVDLIQVDVVDVESAQAVVDRVLDVLGGEPALVAIVTHRAVHLGRDHDLLARDLEVLQRAAEHALALALRVDVGGVEEVDAVLERLLDVRQRGGLIEHPVAPLRRAV